MKLDTFRRLDQHDRRIRQLERTEPEAGGGGGGDHPDSDHTTFALVDHDTAHDDRFSLLAHTHPAHADSDHDDRFALIAAGVPVGGAAGQVLTKDTGTDHDTSWQTPAAGGGIQTPIGAVVMWTTATPPTGWLLCDGAAIPGGYTALIALVGANTPDLRGRVPLGVSASYPLASTGGAATATLTAGNLPAHTHGSSGTHGHTYDVGGASPGTANAVIQRGSGSVVTSIASAIQNTSGGHTHTSVGSDTPFSLLNPYQALNFIIRAA